jgi:hypothetical protein
MGLDSLEPTPLTKSESDLLKYFREMNDGSQRLILKFSAAQAADCPRRRAASLRLIIGRAA